MSLQIRKIVLYSLSGQIREVDFQLGSLNIITGASKTGKSAIIDIIDYCTGRSECYVAEGIQRYVSWFGVLFEESGSQVFVARRSPAGTARTSSDVYFEQGSNLSLPGIDRISKNSTVDAVTARLSRMLGIRENRHVGRPSQTRVPLEANIRHGLLLCIQDQNDIDNRSYLFHRQSETFVAVDIRHTLPYFLGAIDEERLLRQAQLEGARRELRRLERQLAVVDSGDTEEFARAQALLAGAVSAGVLSADEDVKELRSALEVLRAVPTDEILQSSDGIGSGDNQLEVLRVQRQGLRTQLSRVRDAIREAQVSSVNLSGYEREAGEQRGRLSSIGLFESSNGSTNACPLCTNTLSSPIPSANDIRESLEYLSMQLQTAEAENPRIQSHLINLINEERSLIDRLRENHQQIDRSYRQNELLRDRQNEAVIQAHIVGRITQYLDTIPSVEVDPELDRQVEEARRVVNLLEEELDPDVVHENADTFLSFVSDYLTEYARRLNLEYSVNRVRLDIRRLTVVADTLNGPVTLDRMGSGENWVGYHVISHLALHRWFRAKDRPVPGFLVLDQPSQAHYPPETDMGGSIDHLEDEDKTAVQSLYKLIAEVAQVLSPSLQIIVLDHARIDESWFTDSIVEEWRVTTGTKLLPRDWIPEEEWAWALEGGDRS